MRWRSLSFRCAKIEEDMRRQTVLERIGWSFIRLRGSEYFRDPEKAMNRVVRELEELGIYPDKKQKKIVRIMEINCSAESGKQQDL